MNKPAFVPSTDRAFFVDWMVANFIGGAVATGMTVLIVAMYMFSRAEITQIALIAGAVMGAILGTMQWLALRTRLPGSWGWIIATTVGFALGVPLVFGIQRTTLAAVPEFLSPYLLALLFGSTLGLCQWFVLRKRSWSGLWIVATALIMAVFIPLVQLLASMPFADGTTQLGYGVLFLMYALVTGGVLLWLLKPVPAGIERPIPRSSQAFSLTLVAGISLVIALLWLQIFTQPPVIAISALPATPAPYPTPRPAGPGELVLAGHLAPVRGVAFSPDGRTVASASEDSTLKIWDVQTGASVSTFKTGAEALSLAYAPDGKTLAAGVNARGGQPNLKVWDIATGKQLQGIVAHAQPVYTVAYSPDGRLLVTGSTDRTVAVWRVDTWLSRGILSGHSDWVYSVAVAPNSATVASASWDHSVKLWNLDSQAARTLSGHTDKVMSVAFSPDGRLLASGAMDFKIKLWDVATGAEVRTLSGHQGTVNSVSFASDGRTLASASDDRTVKLWEVATGSLLHSWEDHSDRVTAVAFSPDHSTIVSGAANGSLRLRRIDP